MLIKAVCSDANLRHSIVEVGPFSQASVMQSSCNNWKYLMNLILMHDMSSFLILGKILGIVCRYGFRRSILDEKMHDYLGKYGMKFVFEVELPEPVGFWFNAVYQVL